MTRVVPEPVDFFWNSPHRVRRAIEDILKPRRKITEAEFMRLYFNRLEVNGEDVLLNEQGSSSYTKAGLVIVLQRYFGMGYRNIGKLLGCEKTSLHKMAQRYESEICAEGDIQIYLNEGPRHRAELEKERRMGACCDSLEVAI